MNIYQLIGGAIIAIALVINMFAPRLMQALKHSHPVLSNRD